MRTVKASDGSYVLGAPNVDVRPQIWGVDVVPTKSCPAGTFIAGSFKAAATIYDRWQPTILVSSEHADLFIRNCLLILGENRVGMAVKAPLALVKGTFAA
jgi:HK97 family phage major capsid protein